MRLPSGTVDQFVYFYAVDAVDFTTPETGLAATSPTFRVYRSRNGAAAAPMTTPTINEVDATNMPGVYELLLDEDTTIASGNDSEEMVLHISHDSMAPVVRTIELYRPKFTEGSTLSLAAINAECDTALADYDAPTKAELDSGLAGLNDLSAAQVNAEVDTALADYDAPTKAEMDAGFAALNDVSSADVNAACDTALVDYGANTVAPDNASIAAILTDTGTTLPAQIAALNNLSSADVNAACDTALSDYDGPTKAELDAGFAALNDLSSAEVTAAVPTATENADALLNRDMGAVTVTNSRSPINALRFLRNKWSVTGTTLTVTAENDSTVAWSATLSTDASADPVTGSDPS